MAITPTDVTLTGTLTDLQGNALNGTLTFSLQGFGSTVPKISGTELLPGIVFTATVTSGTFSSNFYSNQIITPGPLVTFYSIAFVATGNTNQVYNFAQNYQFSPGTFDLSQLTPLNAVISNTSLPNTVTPHTSTFVNGQFLSSLTSTGTFTTGPSNLVSFIPSGSTNADTGLSRDSAGVIDVGNGTQGDKTGTINATTLGLVSTGVAKWSTDVGISRLAANTLAIGNGTQGDMSATIKGTSYIAASAGVYAFNQTGADTGVSRLAAASVAIGNGTQGDFSGTLKLTTATIQGLIGTYNAITTAGNGVASVYAATAQKAETGAADANVLTYTPPAATGTYRVSVAISVTSATSGVIGWTLTWTDSSGNSQAPGQAQALFQQGTAAPALTFTVSAAGNYQGSSVIDINNAAANIIIKWVGGGTTVAKMSAVIERLV